MTQVIRKKILVTGASSGIGAACVALFSRNGYLVFAGIRDRETCERYRPMNECVIPVWLDVTDPQSLENTYARIFDEWQNGDFFSVINNAGVAVAGPVEVVPIRLIREQFEINVMGTINVMKKFAPLLRKGKGTLVNIGSISGRVSGPYLGIYAASKFAVRALTDAIRLEVTNQDIRVVLVEPGRVATPIWEKMEEKCKALDFSNSVGELYNENFHRINSVRREKGKMGIDPLKVAEKIIRILNSRAPKPHYYIGADALVIGILIRVFPEVWVSRLISHQVNKGANGR